MKVWKGKKVSVVFPTYNEKESIYDAIIDFFKSGYVDEIIVVNNNAAPGTSEEVRKTKAKLVFEKKQGYGFSIRKGLSVAKGDYIIISEPDGTFSGDDVIKFFSYSDDFDVVFGTRTTSALIGEGANMGFFLKWGNWFTAKVMEILFNTTHISDVGCTYKLYKRSALRKIQRQFLCGGSTFGLEMMLLTAKNRIKFVEIPIKYRKRIGESSVTGSKYKAFVLGLQMLSLIFKYRFGLTGSKN